MFKEFIQTSKFEKILFFLIQAVGKYNVEPPNLWYFAIVTIQIKTDVLLDGLYEYIAGYKEEYNNIKHNATVINSKSMYFLLWVKHWNYKCRHVKKKKKESYCFQQ